MVINVIAHIVVPKVTRTRIIVGGAGCQDGECIRAGKRIEGILYYEEEIGKLESTR